MALPRPEPAAAAIRQRPAFRLGSRSRLALLCLTLTVFSLAVLAHFGMLSFGSGFSIAAGGVVLWLLINWTLRPLRQEVLALNLHAQNLQDGSFNTSANQLNIKELSPLADSLITMSAQLRAERASLYQRELLLDTVLQSSPTALVLTNHSDTVLMGNPAACLLLNNGKKFTGSKLSALTDIAPPLQQALKRQQQGLIRLDNSGQAVWHLSINQFQLNQQQHWLYLLKPLSREIQREELNAWKKLLRVIGHELNNTLAPLSSLAFSGRQLAARQQQTELSRLFDTISERSRHLNQFVQAYINFAKLPPPQLTDINWPRLINQLQDHYEFELLGDLPKRSWQADPQQLAQLLLNLLKNAHESGSATEHISLRCVELGNELQLQVTDGGGGIAADLLQQALVPFYSSKPQGSGIGLTLCRDIAEAHAGGISLHNVSQQIANDRICGLQVTVTLPTR
ncbi:Histidine kinase-, DNA gyrase B-, and HSP90-like ATPase [Arsukibacterium tuosuense]|uniref:histidine kinase n=1 Tax=Arsukibacterium tuosuense TaxID=1323745 RepID=A0A285ISA4_9GAMM|nr:ATP-binding protein [Arsukibacterium tuosuense]SNY50890.1 Histidine kinase-, DNA gyrase B-, and HSP90-like ATPase [Arsukibacterium tuosuense]